jgi:hypothetical protein
VPRQAQFEPVDWRRAYRLRRDAERFDLRDPDVEPKGWKRTRHKISQRDLLVPLSASRLKLLGACTVCGCGLSLLWVYFPILLVTIPLDAHIGLWLWGSMAVFASVATVVLFLYASAREEEYLEELQ